MQRAGHSSPCTRANKCQSFSSNHFNWRLIWQMSNIPMHYLYQWLFSYIRGPCPVLYKTCLLFLFWPYFVIRHHERCDTSDYQGSQQGRSWQDRMESAGEEIAKQSKKKNLKETNNGGKRNILLWTTSILYPCRWSTISRWRWSRRAPRCTSSLPRGSPVRGSRWGWGWKWGLGWGWKWGWKWGWAWTWVG